MDKTHLELYFAITNNAEKIRTAIGNARSSDFWLSIIIIVLCCIIIYNQRKIKKMLRDLQEQMEQKEQDKPD